MSKLSALGYSARPYSPKDETKLVELFNKHYQQYAGVVLRDITYWKWCCPMRPGVEKEGIIILTKGDDVMAYAVVGRSGDIYEFCYDDGLDSVAILHELFERVLAYLKDVGANSVKLLAPSNDHIIEKVLVQLGFTKRSRDVMGVVRCTDFFTLLRQILETRTSAGSLTNEAFLIRLSGPPPPEEAVYVVGGQVIRGGPSTKPSITMETSKGAMLSLIFGRKSKISMVLTGTLHVKPLWKIHRAFELLSLLRIRAPWYTPAADLG